MRPPSFKMEVPADIKPPRDHDPPIEVNQLPPAKSKTPGDSDETEYSTSFADTTSTNDNNSSTPSDAEVESQLDSAFSSPFDEFGCAFRARKKKLTSQWRSFIRPVMWRCKWAELKIKQFESQALRYAKTKASHSRAKHLANQSIPDGFSSRSMPFTCQRRPSKLMKRRKRVRLEDTIDAKVYMSKHILFSYHETRKSDPDGISITDDFDDPALAGENITSQEEVGVEMHNNLTLLEDKDNDMEQMLRKIDIAQTRVHKLKGQLELVISENVNHLPFEAQTSTVRSPTFSTCNGDTTSAGGIYAATQHTLEFDMPEHAVSSYGEGFHIPDIIESTVGLPSSVDVTHHESQIGDSCENIHNEAVVKQEGDKSEEEEESTHAGESQVFQIPKNKRKRGERKAGTGNWSRQ